MGNPDTGINTVVGVTFRDSCLVGGVEVSLLSRFVLCTKSSEVEVDKLYFIVSVHDWKTMK